MADPHRSSNNGMRSLMGPPETPSRTMGTSPNLFPTLQFSPDAFSAQALGPMTAPVFPQQRLFWDSASPQPAGNFPAGFTGSLPPNNFDGTFSDMAATTVPGFSPVMPQEQPYDLPTHPHSANAAFLNGNTYPAPFHTSPRVPLPPAENPTLFLSSPARRFGGGTEANGPSFPRRPPRDIPAYHHQIEESRRELELEKRRRSRAAKRADDALIMSSVRRALSPSKQARPGLKRSNTHTGASAAVAQLRRQNKLSFNDSASVSSATSNASSRNGRSSPLKQTTFSGISRNKAAQKPRKSMSLAIDEDGVAKTVLEEVEEPANDMDLDDESSDNVLSSGEENDFDLIHSQTTSFALNDDNYLGPHGTINDPRNALRISDLPGHGSINQSARNSLVGMRAEEIPDATVRASKRLTVSTNPPLKGDAQKALMAILHDRSRSASTQDGNTSSRQSRSDSSGQFHSSPPINHHQFSAYNASPTTITDPDLATPSTENEFFAVGATSTGRGGNSSRDQNGNQSPLAHKSMSRSRR